MKHLRFAVVDNNGYEIRFDKENIGMRLVIREKNEHTLQVNLKDITSNLICIWHFENNGIDESGYNNHAIIHGGTFVDTKIGKGLSLDGIDDYATASKFDFANREPFTISFWVKPITIKNGYARLFSKEEYSNGRQGWLIFQTPDGRIGFERWRDDNGGGVLTNSIINTDRFYHIVCVYDGIKSSIYVDGVLENYSNNSIEMISNNAPFVIGASSYYADNFNGIIDEVRIYNRALTDREVREVYESRSKYLKIFEGLIIEVDEVGEFDKIISITARDLFKDRLLTRVINKKYIDMKASDIFKDIVRELGSEFTLNGVEDLNIIVSEDFPYIQAQLAADILAEDTSTEYFCKPNLDCVFRELRVDDSGIIITEDMIKSPAEVRRSYAESISEVIVVGGFDENNNRVIARAVNNSLPEALLGRKYVLHDKRYTTYTSAKLRALSILNSLSKMFTLIDPIYVRDLKELPFAGELVTLQMPAYGLDNVKMVVKEIEINVKAGEETTWFKLYLGEKEENLEDKIIAQQQVLEKERILARFAETSTQRLVNTNDQLITISSNRIRRCKGFYLDAVPPNVEEGLEFGLDGKYASQLDL